MSRIQASDSVIRRLALFRYGLRRFLRFSEKAVREAGVTPSQHQLLLGVAGFTPSGRATISELAEFLQQRHNAVVGLVNRAAAAGLVRRERSSQDRRCVKVGLTSEGTSLLRRLSRQHIAELGRIGASLPPAAGNRRRRP